MNLYKVVLIGEPDVGKSSTFVRFRDNIFVENIKSTIGLDNATKEIKFQKSESDPTEMSAKIQLWDTAGLERAGRMTNNYYHRCDAVILMYDITDRASLSHLRAWHEEVTLYTKHENTKYFVVGNKKDRKFEKEVGDELAIKMSRSLSMPENNNFRMSAKTGEGLEEMLVQIARILSDTVQPVRPSIPMIADSKPSSGIRCCGSLRRTSIQ